MPASNVISSNNSTKLAFQALLINELMSVFRYVSVCIHLAKKHIFSRE